MVSLILYMDVRYVASTSLSGTFLCVMKQAQSDPRTATAVLATLLDAFNAYSGQAQVRAAAKTGAEERGGKRGTEGYRGI